MFMLTIVLSISLKWVLPDPIKNTEMRNEFWLRKTHNKNQFDFVIGGDSRTYRGVSPNEISSTWQPNSKGFNLGYSSGGFSAEYLDFLADKTKPNGMIILGITPHSLTLEAAKNELFHDYQNTAQFDLFKGLYLSKYLKHVAPYKLTEVLDYLAGKIPEDRYYETFYPENGWVKSHRIPEDSAVALDIYEGLFERYQTNDSLQNELMSTVDSLSQEGYDIYAFRVPAMQSMIVLENDKSGFDEETFSKLFQQSGGIWLDIDPTAYHTYDGSHLHYESAIRLSQEIGRQINNNQ